MRNEASSCAVTADPAVGKKEDGFTLAEVMVSMVLFLIVTGTIWGLLQVAQQGRSAVNLQSPLNRSLRVSLNLLGRDTYNAGFGYPVGNTVVLPNNRVSILLELPADVDPSRDTIPPIIAGNNVRPNTFNISPGVMTDQVTFLFKDTTFNLVGQVSQPLNIDAATTTAGIDEVVPISGSNAECRVNDIYLVTGNTGSTLAVATGLSGSDTVLFSDFDLLDFNQPGAGGPLSGITTPASLQRVLMVTYFVTPDGTLTRRKYANVPPPAASTAFVDEPLVYGVEDFQIKYVMEDGTLTDNPSAGPDGIPGNADDEQANLTEVRQIRFTVSARTVDAASTGQPVRATMTSTFSTRNLGYDAN